MSGSHRAKPLCVRSKRRGFTLLEVMLAVLILGTALVALTRMLVLGRVSADADAKRIVALSILRREADLVQARGYSSLVTEAPRPVASQPDYERSVTVTDAGNGLKLVTVTVAWDSPTGKAVSESVQFLVGDAVLPVRSWEVP